MSRSRRNRPLRLPTFSLAVATVIPVVAQLVVVVVVTWVSFRGGQRSVNDLTLRLLNRSADRLQADISQYLQPPQRANQTIRGAIALGVLDPRDTTMLSRFLAQQLVVHPTLDTIQFATIERDYLGVGRTGAEGETLTLKQATAATGYDFVQFRYQPDGSVGEEIDRQPGYVLDRREWYTTALAREEPGWSAVYAMSDRLGIMRAETIRDSGGRTLGVLGTDIRLDAIARFLATAAISPGSKLYLVDGDTNSPIASSSGSLPVLTETAQTTADGTLAQRSIAELPQLQRLLERSQQQGYAPWETTTRQVWSVRLDGDRYFVQVAPIAPETGLNWRLFTSVPEADFLDDILTRTRQTVIVCGLVLLASISAGIYLGRSLGRPLLDLSRASEGIASGQLDLDALMLPTSRLRIHEIETLRQAFCVMRDRVQSAFDRLEERVAERTAALSRSRARFASIFEASPTPSVIFSRQTGNILETNASFMELFELDDRPLVIGKNERELGLWGDAEQRSELVRRIEQGEEITAEEVELRTHTGRWVTVLLSATEISLGGEVCLLGTLIDITDRRRLALELRQSKQFLDNIIENLPLAVFVKDVRDDFRLTLLNQGYEKISGRSRDELRGKTVSELYRPHEAELFRQHDLDTVAQGKIVSIEAESFTNALGQTLTLRTTKVPIRDETGAIAHLLCISEDITELQRSNAELHAQREAALDGILVFDGCDRICAHNHRFLEQWGIPDALFDAGTDAVLDAMRSQLRLPNEFSATLSYLQEFRFDISRDEIDLIDGRTFERYSSPLYSELSRAQTSGSLSNNLSGSRDGDDRSEYYGRIWFFRDMTELRQKQRQLRDKEAYMRMILDNIPQQVFWKDTNLVFQGCNLHWAKAAGLAEPDEAIGKTDFDLLPADLAEEFRQKDMDIMATDTPSLHVEAVKFKPGQNGQRIWLDISKLPIHDRDGNVIGILGVLDDITVRREAEEALRLEQQRSEELLLNILPKPIADRLKVDRGAIAKHFDLATILFADIVGFTPLSAELEPIVLVCLLNRIFSTFDERALFHGLEKIKTIGDAYMVAGGLPMENAYHIEAIAEMALDMQQAVHTLRQELDRDFAIRVGIHIGPVVAGVIGTSKFIYDLWGDTVNVASRMESSGVADRIQISAEMYSYLANRYRCELRGEIEVKGKGKMRTYWLIDRSPFYRYVSEAERQQIQRQAAKQQAQASDTPKAAEETPPSLPPSDEPDLTSEPPI